MTGPILWMICIGGALSVACILYLSYCEITRCINRCVPTQTQPLYRAEI